MRFLIKLITIENYDVNFHDKNNIHIGFQILNSNISKRNKILLFKLLVDQIDSMTIKDNIPLLLYCVIIDEYEITYLLLNKMIVNKNIKKKSSNVSTFSDYEYLDGKININFIPVILKYIKEHSAKNQIEINKLCLEVDIYVENILVMIVELIVFVLLYKYNISFTSNKHQLNKIIETYEISETNETNETNETKETKESKANKSNKSNRVGKANKINKINRKSNDISGKIIRNIYKDELNGYLAIDKNISNEETSQNGYMEISVDTNSITLNPNKNIWKGVKYTETIDKKQNKKHEPNIKFKLKSESLTRDGNTQILDSDTTSFISGVSDSESFEIEESEICFENFTTQNTQ
jgi:hypothetical protein